MSGECEYLGKWEGFRLTYIKNTEPSEYLPHYHKFARDYWRSPASEEDLRKDVLAYGNTVERPNDRSLSYAISLANDAFKLPQKVKMLALSDVFAQKDLGIWDKSPGLPWIKRGFKSKNDIRKDPKATKQVIKFWEKVKTGQERLPDDTCAFVRRHITERDRVKVRAILGYPATITLGEVVFAHRLTQTYLEGGSPLAYGYETLKGGAMRIFQECYADWYAATDFKSFDKTVPKFLIEAAFNILMSNIDFEHYHDSDIVPDSREMVLMYEYLVHYFIYTPIRFSNGERYRKNGGIASGSMFTQLVGSIVNFILIYWASLKQKGRPRYIKVFGDDSICGYNYKFNLHFADELFHSIRMKLNLEKSSITNHLADVKFLGYKINNGLPSRDFNQWMASLLYPERPDEDWDHVASRALSLIYCNGGIDERFDAICRNIVRKRRFKVSLSKHQKNHLKMIGYEPENITGDPPERSELIRKLTQIELNPVGDQGTN